MAVEEDKKEVPEMFKAGMNEGMLNEAKMSLNKKFTEIELFALSSLQNQSIIQTLMNHEERLKSLEKVK